MSVAQDLQPFEHASIQAHTLCCAASCVRCHLNIACLHTLRYAVFMHPSPSYEARRASLRTHSGRASRSDVSVTPTYRISFAGTTAPPAASPSAQCCSSSHAKQGHWPNGRFSQCNPRTFTRTWSLSASYCEQPAVFP